MTTAAQSRAKNTPVLVEGVRSAFAASLGAFEEYDTLELFSRVINALIIKTDLDPNAIEEIVTGCALPQGRNQNLTRDVIITLGLPPKIHGYVLNRSCGSGLQTVFNAMTAIRWGHPRCIIAGGVDCLSDIPLVYSREARKFMHKLAKANSAVAKLNIIKSFRAKEWFPKTPELFEHLTNFAVGEQSEVLARKYGVTRHLQDVFAANSHAKAFQAKQERIFQREIVPIWPPPQYKRVVLEDDNVREDVTRDGLAKLIPLFDAEYGTITIGNSAALADGAAVCLVMDREEALHRNMKPKASLIDYEAFGIDAATDYLIGPAIGIGRLLQRNQLSLRDIDLFEIQENCAAQVLASVACLATDEFGKDYLGREVRGEMIPAEHVNCNGGAIAFGHPYNAMGLKLLMNLANSLERTKRRRGVISLCTPSGIVNSLLIERHE